MRLNKFDKLNSLFYFCAASYSFILYFIIKFSSSLFCSDVVVYKIRKIKFSYKKLPNRMKYFPP